MVAHDPKTGKSTRPTVRGKDGGFPNDPQINPPDREPDPKPQAGLAGYVKGGTTNPSEGESGDVEYFDADGKPSSAEKVLADSPVPSGKNKKKG